MQTITFKSHQLTSEFIANEVINAIKNKPNLSICLASGNTTALPYDILAKKILQEKIDYSKVNFFGLDEWVGLGKDNAGSCHHFFNQHIFEPLQIKKEQCFLFDANANDLQNECAKMDAQIIAKGGIDMMIVGIGLNGHIGFNEPGTSFTSLCHVIHLDALTKSVGRKYFTSNVELDKGITVGLQHLQNAKGVYLIANGIKKSGVIKKTIEESASENFPASIMQTHHNGFVLIDEEAGSLLKK